MSNSTILKLENVDQAKKDGYQSIGVAVTGTEEEILHIFRFLEAKLVKIATRYGTNQNDYDVLVKSLPVEIHWHGKYAGLGIQLAGNVRQVIEAFGSRDVKFIKGDPVEGSNNDFFYYPMVLMGYSKP